MEIDPVDELRNVRQAEATLASSQARLEQAKLNLEIEKKRIDTERQRLNATLKSAKAKAVDEASKAERMKELLNKKLIGQEEYDSSLTSKIQAESNLVTTNVLLKELEIRQSQLAVMREDIKLNEANVERDQINLSNSQRRLEETKVYSPITGAVSNRMVQVGQIISSGITNVGGGSPVMILSDLSKIFVVASVDESDIGNVDLGQSVTVTVDAFPKWSFQGEVIRIAVQGANLSNVVTFEVKIEILDDRKQLLKPEMTANVEILVAERNNTLLVPSEAVSVKKNRHWITVLTVDGQEERRLVETGITDYESIEILSGIQKSDRVVIQENDSDDSRWSRSKGMLMPPPPRPR